MTESHPESPAEKELSPEARQELRQELRQKETSSAEKIRKNSTFGLLNKDLQQALNNWEVLTEEMSQKTSPEEKQLRDVKRLLGELKSKLKQFED